MTEPEFKEKVIGKKIVDCTFTSVKLEDGTEIEWRLEGDLGADMGWYPFMMVYFDNKKITRL